MTDSNWVEIAKVGDIDDEEAIKVDVDGNQIALYFVEDEYYATDDCCTHAKASLSEGYIDGTTIECPLHQGVFCLKTGKCLQPPVDKDVLTYPIRVEGENILIHVPSSL